MADDVSHPVDAPAHIQMNVILDVLDDHQDTRVFGADLRVYVLDRLELPLADLHALPDWFGLARSFAFRLHQDEAHVDTAVQTGVHFHRGGQTLALLHPATCLEPLQTENLPANTRGSHTGTSGV